MTVQAKQFYDFSAFRLDATEGVLLRDGKPVPITPKAFELLRVLVENHGHILCKEDLLRQVWPDTFVEEGNLPFNISQLRKALSQTENGITYIETIPKRGYRFAAAVTVVNGGGLPAPVAAQAAPQPAHDAVPQEAAAVDKKPLRVLIEWRPLVATLVGLVALFLAVSLGMLRGRLPWSHSGAVQIQSIAVLPFENLSRDPEQDYLADGMTDELITNLGTITELRVISRTSAMHYKGTNRTLPEIARELNVDGVIEGSVMHSGDRVRVTAQLVQATMERHLWGKTYDRELGDVMALQDEIARDVAGELRIELTASPNQVQAYDQAQDRTSPPSLHLNAPKPQVRTPLVARPINPQAFEAYLKGRYYAATFTSEGSDRAIHYFHQAIAIDPGYALPYEALAYNYILESNWPLPPNEAMPKARDVARKALQLDDTLAGAHTSLASVLLLYDWNWSAAESELNRALELNPSYAPAHYTRSWLLMSIGRFDQAVGENRRAQELDPLALDARIMAGITLSLCQAIRPSGSRTSGYSQDGPQQLGRPSYSGSCLYAEGPASRSPRGASESQAGREPGPRYNSFNGASLCARGKAS